MAASHDTETDKLITDIMKLLFHLEYRTVFGEELTLNITDGDAGTVAAHGMSTTDGMHWTCEITADARPGTYMDYFYAVCREGCMVRKEWPVERHRVEFAGAEVTRYTMYDNWTDTPDDAYMYSAAFTDCVEARKRDTSADTEFAATLRIKVRAPQLRQGERLAVTGNDAAMGGWRPEEAIMMKEHGVHEWVAVIDAAALGRQETEFKFVTIDDRDGSTAWETGSNRRIAIPTVKEGETVVLELPQARFDRAPWRAAGTVIPIFSLRSEGSFGVGDFGDLRLMTDWADMTGQRVIQVLPINDTGMTHTWTDSYPYNSISIYALHPQYTDFRRLPALKDEARRKHFERLRTELNALPQIDYERVNRAKTEYLRELFAQEGATVMMSAEFKTFFDTNREWLVPYAAFCHYRDMYGTATFGEWPDHKTLTDDERERMGNRGTTEYKEVAFWYFVQFNLDTQMREVHEYARSKRVILKGDIPIGISRDGVEAWVEPRYFNMDGQAGAPPDAFSANGQNWGFPTYNWDEMTADGCRWWVRRFTKMAQYFDAYRIDHVLGFFRIWEIPSHSVHGLLGQFAPSLGMTRGEIEAYGLPFNEKYFTEPFISDRAIEQSFGDKAPEVKAKYLEHCHGDMWRMRPEYDTQRKVEAAFKGMTAPADTQLRDRLYALISDVLFVRDHNDDDKFHPRIGVQGDFVYETLCDEDRHAFNRLYNDYFYRRNNSFWHDEAMKKLPLLIQATRMLVCAEDLGMVPACVPGVMNELRILSLEIQSMPKTEGLRFGDLSQNPYRSVCTFSTHDMPTLRQWWDEDEQRAREYFNTVLHKAGDAPHPLPGWLAEDIVDRQLASPSMLCLLSLQDWLATDEKLRLPDKDAERINIPANPRHYWRYRMHLTIEQLMEADGFNSKTKSMIIESGR